MRRKLYKHLVETNFMNISSAIKQFKKVKNCLFEKNYILDKNYKVKQVFRKASTSDSRSIKSYRTLKKLKFIEYPKMGFKELDKIVKKISKLKIFVSQLKQCLSLI